jgi:hypothetical protein
MHYLLYEITNLVNDKNYIGQHTTNNVEDGYMGSGKLITAALKKYGKENFKKEILLYAKNEVALNFFERSLVTPEFCALESNYNLREGGGYGGKHSQETINKILATKKAWSLEKKAEVTSKISAAHIGIKRGPHSPETKVKISAGNKGKKLSLETKAKLSQAKKGKKGAPRTPEWLAKIQETKRRNGTNKGRKHTPEARAKISAALKGKITSPETRAKMSIAAKTYNAMKGKKHTPEARAKMSAAHKSKKHNQQLLNDFKKLLL